MAYLRCVGVGSVGWFRAQKQKHMFCVLLAHTAHRVLHSLTGRGLAPRCPCIDQQVGVLWRPPVTAGFGLVQPQRAKVAASAGCCRMCLVAVLWCGLCCNLRRDCVYTRVSHAACCGGFVVFASSGLVCLAVSMAGPTLRVEGCASHIFKVAQVAPRLMRSTLLLLCKGRVCCVCVCVCVCWQGSCTMPSSGLGEVERQQEAAGVAAAATELS
jgi:hypothetical protein